MNSKPNFDKIGNSYYPYIDRQGTMISGGEDAMSGNVKVHALFQMDGNILATAEYVITDNLIDDEVVRIPEWLYSWYPQYTGGTVSDYEKKESMKNNVRWLLQDYLCHHAHAHLILSQLAEGRDVRTPLRFAFSTTERSAFELRGKLPPQEDLLARLNSLIESGNEMFIRYLSSPHIALFYGLKHTAAESFLGVLNTKGLIETAKKSGFSVPYGSRQTADAMTIKSLTKDGLSVGHSLVGKAKCFVVMPLSGLEDVYSVVQEAWRSVFGPESEVYHQDDDPDKGASELMDQKIQRNIENAAVVVSIMSMGMKERPLFQLATDTKAEVLDKAFPTNANVVLETGYAIRCKHDTACACKEVIVLAEPDSFVFLTKSTFDMRNRSLMKYERTESGLSELKGKLVESFAHIKKQHRL
ncbi:MAG: hypothetical protein PHE68_01645 [Candidatus Peribacteraceae bacterium]|nr:hypothetical protein [Candidatus Peribacteraceae bacterium]